MENMLSTLASMLPLFIILLAANAAERKRRAARVWESLGAEAEAGGSGAPGPDDGGDGWRILTYVTTVGLMLLVMVTGGFVLVADLLASAGLLGEPDAGPNPLEMVANPGLMAWGFILSGLVGILLLLPPVRRALARLLPIDAGSVVHAVALSFTMLVVVNMLSTLALGLSQLAELVGDAQAQGEGEMVTIGGLWVQQLLFAALGVVGVGWPVRRSLGETLARLGLVLPTLNQVLLGVGLAVVLVGMVIVAQLVGVMMGFGPNADVEKLTEQLLGDMLTSPWGILTIGLAAAIGEETLMRGAVQPRLGLVLTSFLFALLHSQYGITFSTWAVFGVGLVLGYIRMRHNTTMAMVTHAAYNILFGLMAWLSIDFLENMR